MTWNVFPPFESSNLASARYDDTQSILEVTFHNGGTYQYFDVPPHVAEAMKNADSKGVFLAANVKGHYRYSKA